jgi:carbon monoxide dehydrogenase subunit G
MYKFETSIYIHLPPQEVFDYVTNPANNAQWMSGTESAIWKSNGKPGVGSTYVGVFNFLGRKIEGEVEVTDWDPPNRWSFKSVDGPIPSQNTTKFEAQGDGTLVSHTTQVEIGGFFKLAEGLAGKQLEKLYETNNAALKLLLEAGELETSR